MQSCDKCKNLWQELKSHAPFTLFGAVVGLLCVFAARDISHETSHRLFSVFHPLHVVLSAMATASLFKIKEKKNNFLTILLVGFFGSIGVATLSDSLIPFVGEDILGVTISTHSAQHDHSCESNILDQCDNRSDKTVLKRLHLGFIEEWYAVIPAALLGIFIAYYFPATKLPHAAHVLISTWASYTHILMNNNSPFTITILLGLLIVLFLSVWLPCCVSDIIFPMLFTNNSKDKKNC